MSLATDILNSNAVLTPPAAKKPNRNYIEMAKAAPKRRKWPPGVTHGEPRSNRIPTWRAYTTVSGRPVNLGSFLTPERAAIAYRLYSMWQRRGYTDIPHKPTIRLYSRRIAD